MKNRKITILSLLIIVLALCSCGKTEENTKEIIIKSDAVVLNSETNLSEAIVEATDQDIKDEIVPTAPKQKDTKYILDGKVTTDDYAVIINEIEVVAGAKMNKLIDKLGKYDSYSSAKSCIEVGDEKRYQYGDYIISTYPSGKDDIIYLIEFEDKACTIANIGIGSLRSDVEKAYGKDYTLNGETFVYGPNDSECISIEYEDDKVSYIDIYYKPE